MDFDIESFSRKVKAIDQIEDPQVLLESRKRSSARDGKFILPLDIKKVSERNP